MTPAKPILRWTDACGIKRCSHWPHSHDPRVATSIEVNGFCFVIGDAELAMRAAERRAREGRPS